MNYAKTLRSLRQPGRTDDDMLDCLRALASPLHADDPTCMAIDVCINSIEAAQAAATDAALWTQDDAECKRGNAAEMIARVNRFLLEAL